MESRERGETIEKRVRRNINIVSRKICDSFFLIDITDNYADDKCALFEINETGKFIWDQINGKRTVKDLATELHAAIIDEVDFSIIYDDTSEFIDMLLLKCFVEEKQYG